ncbi:mediator of RNA polymerase II transcription subunit 34-like protein [Carex littledalei]|uniref:ATP-dependent DNA helicase n=1 Tax=Carex littledalei TaxID=544730 RepID=A0A833R1R6_9POAL|nr:mediator of RNA polymerase II transcription subunit 34-like protein [Carex littledalei]
MLFLLLISQKYFGYSHFRPYQKEVIEKVLQGRDCLVVMATGSGKSLCYQIPPLISKKTAVVVSPLLSLMQDQVMSLQQRGIKAEYLSSTQSNKSVSCNAEKGFYDILYMTPEKACSLSESFWTNLLEAGICLLAVDEAHCISEWGHDFRKEYKQLHLLHDILSNVPFVALTATVTEKVRNDIVCSLKLREPQITIGSFDRTNLFYGVKSSNRFVSFLDELITDVLKYTVNAGSTIIYCTTIKDTEQIHEFLRNTGIEAGIYHGQMGSKAREESHRSFIRDETHVMVATIAFGVGIDKPDVRCVIHFGCPKSFESYYQESGRCGRDGLPSICWLYFFRGDFLRADFYCLEAQCGNQRKAVESFMVAQKYCALGTCRRNFLLEYFGEKSASACGNCDNCTRPKRERDLSRESFLLLSCIKLCGGNFGFNMPIDVLRGSRAKKIKINKFDKLPMHGLGKDNSSNWWKALGGLLLANGMMLTDVLYCIIFFSVSPDGVQFLCTSNTAQQKPLMLAMTTEMIEEEAVDSSQRQIGNHQTFTSLDLYSFTEAETKLYNMLLDTRMQISKDNGTTPYAICGDQTIIKITKIRPSTRARLANIDGVNQHFVATHGTMILETISRLSQELNLQLNSVVTTVHIQSSSPKELQHSSWIKPKKKKHSSWKKPIKVNIVAWRMWQTYGLSFGEIANWPGRAVPIKEQTVISYVLEAAQGGCEVKWVRFCKEIGLSVDIASQIGTAISKVGARDRLKPIKEELPENVSYGMIKAFLTMEELGLSVKQALSATSSDGQPESTGNMDQNHRHVESRPKKIQKVHGHGLASTNVPEATEDAMMREKP